MKNILLIAISLTLFACSSGGGSSISYTCQLATSCIQVESVSDCSAAGGTVVDACPFNSGGSSSSSRQSGGSSSSSSVGSNGGSGNGNCSGYSGGDGSFSCGGQTYKTVVIGTQTWMAENLNYNVSGSKCYGNDDANCATYGRFYDWATAMNLESGCNNKLCSDLVSPKHQGICPSGWHIPNNEDWDKLFRFADGTNGTDSPYASYTAGRYLKSTSGWNDYNGVSGNGDDTYGFTALPSGQDGRYGGYNCTWWSTYEYNSWHASTRMIYFMADYADIVDYDKISLFSVRCIKD